MSTTNPSIDAIREAIRAGEARNAADPHGTRHFVGTFDGDSAAVCNCGHTTAVTSPGRANAALRRHQQRARAATN